MTNTARKLWIPRPRTALLLAFALVALPALVSACKYVRERADAIAYIESTGGWVVSSDCGGWCPQWLPIPETFLPVFSIIIGETPANLSSELHRVEVFREAQHFSSHYEGFDDRGLQSVSKFRRLESLDLGPSKVTDAGIATLRNCPSLHTLYVNSPLLTDRSLEALESLRISSLSLQDAKITDEGLKHLSGNIGGLNISGTLITDAGLRSLRRLRLFNLDLSNTRVTDAGLAELAAQPFLWELRLKDTKITDAGLRHIPRATTGLWLEGTMITDAGMPELALRRLGHLDLRRTQITVQGLLKLRGMKDLTFLFLSSPPFEKNKVGGLDYEYIVDFSPPDPVE